MTEIQLFTSPEFGHVRTMQIDGKPYFVASDIAKALGYRNIQDAIIRHCRWVAKHDVPHPQSKNKTLEVNVIPEGDIYRLVSQSELQSAEKFESWVFDEVLPTIRKHGMYATDELLDNPDLLIQVATALKTEREKNKLLETENSKLKPKAEFFDAVANSKDAIEIGQVAKVLGNIGRNRLFELLREKKILMSNNQPYQKYIDNGYFRVIEQKFTKPNSEININIKTLVYQKGVDYIRKILN